MLPAVTLNKSLWHPSHQYKSRPLQNVYISLEIHIQSKCLDLTILLDDNDLDETWWLVEIRTLLKQNANCSAESQSQAKPKYFQVSSAYMLFDIEHLVSIWSPTVLEGLNLGHFESYKNILTSL